MVERPVLVTDDEVGHSLALRHGNGYPVGEASRDGNLLNVRQFCERTADSGDTVVEKQVIAVLYVYGLYYLFIGVMLVALHTYIVHAEKDAHHKYCRYDDTDQRIDAGVLPRGVMLAVLALRRLL